MLKPLTLSLSLAVALGACSVSMAGLFGSGSGCSTCGLASPQSAPSAQCYTPVVASAQCNTGCNTGCKTGCGLSNFGSMCGQKLKSCFNKPKCYTYEWVLKKKRVWGCHKNAGCAATGCETCSAVYPSSQGYASPQGYSSPQGYGSPQAYGAYSAPQATQATAPAPASDEAPPAPEVAPAPAAPAPPTPAASNAPASSLLFSSPAGY